MGNTGAPYSVPWPEGTELVRDGDNAIRALAERTNVILSATANGASGGGWGFRGASSVVHTDANGAGVIPINPAFAFDTPGGGGIGSIPIAINGDAAGSAFILGSHVPQAWKNQWTVLVKNPDGSPVTNTDIRINWVAIGIVF